MADARIASTLAHAVELERRDVEAAARLAALTELAARVEAVRRRAEEIEAILASLPDDLARVDEARADAERALHAARAAVAAAEVRRREAEARGRDEAVETAAREEASARTAETEASGRVARLARRRVELEERAETCRTEGLGLEEEARTLAAELRAVPRLARGADVDACGGMSGLAEWGARAHTGLVLARSAVEAERDRIVREANELVSAVLGEPLGAAGVAAARARLERALDA